MTSIQWRQLTEFHDTLDLTERDFCATGRDDLVNLGVMAKEDGPDIGAMRLSLFSIGNTRYGIPGYGADGRFNIRWPSRQHEEWHASRG